MAYVHLANGEVRKLNADEFTKAFGDETPRVFRENGVEHNVIGVYADEVEYDSAAEKAAVIDKADHDEFEEWKANRDAPKAFDGSPL